MYRIVAPTIFVSLFLFLGYGATRVQVSDDVASAMLAKDGGSYENYVDYLAAFPSDAIAIISAQDAACTERGWQLLLELSDALEKLPSSYKVTSIASRNTKIVVSSEEEIYFDDVRDTQFSSADHRCEATYSYRPFNRTLVSPDGAIAILVVPLKSASPNDFASELKNTVATFSEDFEKIGASLVITGDPIMSTEIAETMTGDFIFVALLLVIMMLVTAAFTKSALVSLAVLAVSAFSLIASFGFMGLIGLSITTGSALAVFILVPLSAAFVIHSYGYHTRDATALVPKDSIAPLLIAGVTTSTLFGLTALTPSPDVKSLAAVGSIGILFATLAIFVFAFPIFGLSKNEPYLPRIAVPRWIYLRPSLGYSALVVMLLVCGFGLNRINFEYNAINYLSDSHPARVAHNEVGERFGRMSIPLLVRAEDTRDPETWKALKAAIDAIESRYEKPLQISWLYDPIQEITHALSDGELSFPKDQTTFEQIYLFFSPDDTESFVSQESELINLLVNVPFDSSSEYYKLKDIVSQEFEKHGLDGGLVGRVSGFFETGHRIGLDNLTSLGIGAVFITVLLIAIFRSIQIALILLIVNSLPALTSVAVLSLIGVPIDLGSSIVTAMAFGIVVDDSTHLVVRMKELQKRGYDPLTAVNQALSDLSGPIVITSVTLSVGFCVLFLAELIPFHDFATTILIALSTALIADLVLLPTLVRSFVKDPLR